MTIDPITLEVVRNRFDVIAEEMQDTLLRSAFSPIVREGRDASAESSRRRCSARELPL